MDSYCISRQSFSGAEEEHDFVVLRAGLPLAMPFMAISYVTGSSSMSCISAGSRAFNNIGEGMLSRPSRNITRQEQGSCRKTDVAAADRIEAGQCEKTHRHFCHICARHTLQVLTIVKAGCLGRS